MRAFWAIFHKQNLKRRHTVEAFLKSGFNVRGTVRSKEKGEYLVKLFAGEKTKFEYVIVPDISEVSFSPWPMV